MDNITQLIDNLPRRDPDPNGNVVLAIGIDKDQRCIKVSSSTLSLVSPVFKAMFSSPFLEGRESSSENPCKVDLPDDNANAMIWLCHGIHAVNLSTEARVPIELVERVAVLADKYDCAGAISAWAHIWLRQWSDFDEDTCQYLRNDDRYWDLLRVAIVFDDQRAFYQFSRRLIYYSDSFNSYRWDYPEDPDRSALADTIVGELPGFIETEIRARREAVYKSICDGLEQIVAPALKIDPKTCLDTRGELIPNGNCRRSAKVLNFFHHLTSVGVWPRGVVPLPSKSIYEIFGDLESFSNWRFHGEQRSKKTRFYDKSKCRCVREDYRKAIESIVEREKLREKGLCLACVKLRKADGRTGKVDENCRSKTLIEHTASLARR